MLVKWAVLPGDLLLPKWLDLMVLTAAAVSRQRSPGGRSPEAPHHCLRPCLVRGVPSFLTLPYPVQCPRGSQGELSPGVSGSNLIINSAVLTFLPSLSHFPTLSPCPLGSPLR